MAKTTKTTKPKSTATKATAAKSTTSTKSMKTTSSRGDLQKAEKLDEVKLSAPTKSASKAPANKTVTMTAKTTAKATAATTAKKPTASKAAAATTTTSPEKTMSTTTVTAPARMAAKPKKSETEKKPDAPTIRLESVRHELLMLAQKNGWLRPGLTLDVTDAQLVYTADKWATIHALPLVSLDDDTKGFSLAGAPAQVEIEYAVKASLGLTKSGAKDAEVLASVWLNNRGHNYTTTVRSTLV